MTTGLRARLAAPHPYQCRFARKRETHAARSRAATATAHDAGPLPRPDEASQALQNDTAFSATSTGAAPRLDYLKPLESSVRMTGHTSCAQRFCVISRKAAFAGRIRSICAKPPTVRFAALRVARVCKRQNQ